MSRDHRALRQVDTVDGEGKLGIAAGDARAEWTWRVSPDELQTLGSLLDTDPQWTPERSEQVLLSIYLDTAARSLALDRSADRTHVRVRWYGSGDERSGPWFEIKRVGVPETRKKRLHLHNQRTPRGVEAWESILASARELLPLDLGELGPSLAVQSRRVAFLAPGIRLTLDRQVEWAPWFPAGPEDSMDEALWEPLAAGGIVEWKGPLGQEPKELGGLACRWKHFSKFESACALAGWRS